MRQSYILARNGVFDTIQGEGILLGEPMTFIRLAGCSVGCVGCDTDYSFFRRASLKELLSEVLQLPHRQYVWITGGEPTDHDLAPLISALRSEGRLVGLATSGIRTCPDVDFLSVSPHSSPDLLRIYAGDQINLVPTLGGLCLSDWESWVSRNFIRKYVTPFNGTEVDSCIGFVKRNPGWRLGFQAHLHWGVS